MDLLTKHTINCKNEFDFFAKHHLKIRTKQGNIRPFLLNSAQQYLHEQVERQKAETGKIRAIILKGRQQGISTYVEGRLLWNILFNRGSRAFILTHEQEATDNLFEMSKRFVEHLTPEFTPSIGSSSAKELRFDKLDSGFKVGTAGNKAVGRGSTLQYFHGSEVAFWPNADEHALGIMQAIPMTENTEVFLESTGCGRGNFFYEQWNKAKQGDSEFIAIFIPWYWQEEYVATWRPEWALVQEELDLQRLHNLTKEQLAFRRIKINEFEAGGRRGVDAFKQEYPSTEEEAFDITSGRALEKLSYDIHSVRKFEVPRHWTRFMSIDWGTKSPFAVGWWTVVGQDTEIKGKDGKPDKILPKGALLMYREWYGWTGKPNEGIRAESFEVARKIIEIEEDNGEMMDYRIGDSAMWAQVDGPSIQERMTDATDGMYTMQKSRKDREANYQEIRARIVGEGDWPMFYVMETCKNWWRTVPDLQLDELYPEKGPGPSPAVKEPEDHHYDQTAYACASRPYVTTRSERIRQEYEQVAQHIDEGIQWY